MSWDEHAEGWDDDAAVRAYAGAAYGNLLRLHDAGRLTLDNVRVLDFGCGTGQLTERLAPRAGRVVAIDTSAAMIRVLAGKLERLGLKNVDLIQRSIERARTEHPEVFKDPFDLIVCSSVFAFVDDHPGTVAALAQLLRPGGALVHWDWELVEDVEEPFGLTRSQIRAALEAAGLSQVSVETAFDVEFEGERMKPLMGFGCRAR